MKDSRFCENFGFDEDGRAQRLELVGLTKDDLELARLLHEHVIHPFIKDLVEQFYEQMLQKPQFMEIIKRGEYEIESLKKTQTLYLDSLGINFNTTEYFSNRLKVGLVHADVGVSLSLYQGVYCILQNILIGMTYNKVEDAELQVKLIHFLLKITNLDMSLAISSYNLSRMHRLESNLDALRSERSLLTHKANTDSMTGLLNHNNILQFLARTLQKGQEGLQVYVVMADIDFFKRVNDQYGHPVGDEVIREVAARIRSSLRDLDVIGRYGGEEFMVVMHAENHDQAVMITERIRNNISVTPFHAMGQNIHVTISQGVVMAQPGEKAQSIVDRADRALYRAKHAGRDCVVMDERETSAGG